MFTSRRSWPGASSLRTSPSSARSSKRRRIARPASASRSRPRTGGCPVTPATR
nr:MAG TPA: hypothetical protein [Caudoviricetes sp.]